ncbi:hypothetical protein ACFX10_014818 [Malus domestica]
MKDYPSNIQDEVRRAYLQMGPCRPTKYEFPYTLHAKKKQRFVVSWSEEYDRLESETDLLRDMGGPKTPQRSQNAARNFLEDPSYSKTRYMQIVLEVAACNGEEYSKGEERKQGFLKNWSKTQCFGQFVNFFF